VDAPPSPIGRVGELVGQAVGVSREYPRTRVSGIASITARDFRNDDELGLGIARLILTSSSDVGVDVVDFVDVADDPDLWFVLEEAVDEPLQIGIPEVVVEHSNGDAEVLILRLLISTVLPKARKETELIGIQGERHSMKERYLVCLSGGSDVASRAGVCTQIEGHE